MTQHTTLIYPGAGWDYNFLEYFEELGYTTFILYDTMPKIPHYLPNGCPGFEKQSRFLEILKENFGKCENKSVDELYFPDHNLTYYINTDAHSIKIPDGDILFRGFIPENWNTDDRIVYLSCNIGCKDEVHYDYEVHILESEHDNEMCHCEPFSDSNIDTNSDSD